MSTRKDMTKDADWIGEHPGAPEASTGATVSRRTFIRRTASVAAGLAAAPAAFQATSSMASASTRGGSGLSQLNWAQSSGPPDMNPLRRFDIEGAMVLAQGLEPLLAFSDNLQLLPHLASDYKHSSDLTEWTYRLRDGIHFWDGTPLTIDDVVYSFQQKVSNPQSAFGTFFEVVKDVRARGKTDFVVTLKRPNIVFEYTPAHTAGLIYQKSSAVKMGNKIGSPGHLPVGSGPFKFTDFVVNDYVSLTANPHYWRAKPGIKKLDVRAITDLSSMLLAMEDNEIQGTYDAPPEQFPQWKSALDVKKARALAVAFLAFNVSKPPFDDIHVRRAFSHSIDRAGLVKSATHDVGVVATGFVPPQFWLALDLPYDEVIGRYSKFQQYDFDPAKARAELRKSKHRGGFSVHCDYPNNWPRLGLLLQNLQSNLSPLGIKLSIGEVTVDQWYASLYANRKTTLLNVNLYNPDYPDPDDYVSFFQSSQIKSGNNFFSYKDPEVDRLIAQEQSSASKAVRINAMMKALAIVAENAIAAPVWWEDAVLATHRGITATPTAIWYLLPWASTVKKA